MAPAGNALRLTALRLPFALDELEVARSALERGETTRPAATASGPPAAGHRGERGRRADDAAEGERTQSLPSTLVVHVPILRSDTMLVCTLGDLTLDVVVRLASKIAPGGDTDARIALCAGGQAANVAAWAVRLGASARFLGKTGADDTGQLVRDSLEKLGVDVVGPVEGRNGVICSLVSETGERSMAADRGSATDLRPEEIEEAWFAGCTHLYVSGYALMRAPARRAALRAVELARARRIAVSVDLASWSGIRDTGAAAFRELVAQLRPDVVFANEDEERVLGGPLPGVTWIAKRGARGCSFAGDERAALPVDEVVDTTGAGDALAAGWIVGGADLALEAAAQCVQQVGGMPPPAE